MRKVILATPSYDGRVDVRYADALGASIKLCLAHAIELFPMFVCYDALVQRARNDLLAIAVGAPEVSDLVWIDADMGWRAEQLLRLLLHPVDVVGAVCPKKTDELVDWNVKVLDGGVISTDARGLAEVASVGTGFLRMTRTAFAALWETGRPYRENGRDRRMVFDITLEGGEIVSEDTAACRRLRDLGFPVYIDTQFTCDHVGIKTWRGDFAAWLKQQAAPA